MNTFHLTYRRYIPLFLGLILALVSEYSLASLTATVSKNKVAKGEVFQLKVIADERLSSDDIDFSVLEQDFFIGRPNFAMSVNSFNGKSAIRSEWNLSLAALRAGVLSIPSFTVGGNQTDTLYITSTVDPNETTQDELIEYQSQLNKSQLYPEEIAKFDTRLIIKTNLRRLQNPQITPPQATQGLDLEAIGESKQYQKVIDGVEVTIVDQSYQVSGSQSGQFVITGPSLTGTIIERNPQSGATKLVSINTHANEIAVTILAKPDNFQGHWLPSTRVNLVQTWQDEEGNSIDEQNTFSTRVGAPITRTVTLEVTGVAPSQLPDIELNYPDSIRLYPEQAKFQQLDDRVVMTVKHVIIAKTEGSIELPAIAINWWNTSTKQLASASVSGLTLQVEQGEQQSTALLSNQLNTLPQQDEKVVEVIVTDAGLWPYLSAFFALLWLLFMALWLKAKKATTTQPVNTLIEKDNNIIKQLDSVIAQSDGIKLQTLVTQWLAENQDIDEKIKADIEQEMKAIMKAIYTPDSQSWDKKTIRNLLKKANKQKVNKPDESGLAEL